MSKKVNILVVEDDQFIIDNLYKSQLEDDKFIVDYAMSEIEAKEKIRCKTYQAAYVDIMLRDDAYDRGGVEVIKFINDIKEPTQVIVVSATDDIKVALNVYKAGICDFLPKDSIHIPGSILEPLDKILDSMKYIKNNPFGDFMSLSAYLAFPEMTTIWENNLAVKLATSYKTLNEALNNSLVSMLPILKPFGNESSFTRNYNKSSSNYFWSKGIGAAIMVSLSFIDSEVSCPDDNLSGDIIYEKIFNNLKVVIWKISGMPRSHFLDTVWDSKKV